MRGYGISNLGKNLKIIFSKGDHCEPVCRLPLRHRLSNQLFPEGCADHRYRKETETEYF